MSDVILWSRRRTARYAALSCAARGVMLELVMASNDQGEVILPRKEGLAAVAALIGRPWSEVEPGLQEVLESGKFVHDKERGVLIDQSQVNRATSPDPSPPPSSRRIPPQEYVRGLEVAVALNGSPSAPASGGPEKGTDPSGIVDPKSSAFRGRVFRLRKRVSAGDLAAAAELAALMGARHVHGAGASVRANAPRTFANAPNGERLTFAIDHHAISAVPEQACFPFANERSPSPLSDLKQINTDPERGDRVVLVRANADGSLDITAMPGGWLEHALAKRPDLTSSEVLDSWNVFAVESRKKNASFASWGYVQVPWERWLKRERGVKQELAPRPPKKTMPSAAARAAAEQRAKAEADEQRAIESIPHEQRIAIAQASIERAFGRCA